VFAFLTEQVLAPFRDKGSLRKCSEAYSPVNSYLFFDVKSLFQCALSSLAGSLGENLTVLLFFRKHLIFELQGF